MKLLKELNEAAKPTLYQKITAIVNQIKEETGAEIYTKLGMRVWTRGDGARYKSPSWISAEHDDDVNKAWAWLKKQPRVKTFKVTGEFGSDKPRDTVQFKGLLFIKDAHGIQYATPNLLKSKYGVWRKVEEK